MIDTIDVIKKRLDTKRDVIGNDYRRLIISFL